MNNRQKLTTLAVLAAVTTQVQAQDVYNFYFNKNNPNQKAQIIGSPDQASSPETKVEVQNNNGNKAEIPEEAKSTIAAVKAEKAVKKFESWEFMLGSASSYGWSNNYSSSYDSGYYVDTGNDYDADGLALGISKNFNRYFGADLGLSSMSLKNIDGSEDFFNARFGFSFTPIRLNVVGHDFIELGAIGGIGTFQKFTIENDFGPGGGGWDRGEVVDHVTVARPYLGAKFAINFSSKVAVVLESSSIIEDKVTISNSVFGLRYRFQ